MKFSTNKKELEKALKSLARIAKVTKSGVLLEAAQGEIALTVRDYYNSMTIKLDAEVEEYGLTVVGHKVFSESIKPCYQIVRAELNHGRLTISDGCATVSLAATPPNNYPEIEESDPLTPVLTISQPLFKAMLSQVSFAMSKDDMRPILTGMHWKGTADSFRVIAADGFKVASNTQQTGKDIQVSYDFNITVPKEAINELTANLGKLGTVTAELSHKHIRLSFDNTVMTFRLLDGTYLNIDQYYPQNFSAELTFDSKQLMPILKRSASLMGKDSAINFDISPELIKLSSNAKGSEVSHEERLTAQVEGESMGILFNARILSEAVKATSGKVQMKLTHHHGPCIIRTEAQPEYWSLVMPIRIA